VVAFERNEFVIYENGVAVSRNLIQEAQLQTDSNNRTLHVSKDGRHLLQVSVAQGHEGAVVRIMTLFRQAFVDNTWSSNLKENAEGHIAKNTKLPATTQTRTASKGNAANKANRPTASPHQQAANPAGSSAPAVSGTSLPKLAHAMAKLDSEADWANDFLAESREAKGIGQSTPAGSRQGSKQKPCPGQDGRMGSKGLPGSRKGSKTKPVLPMQDLAMYADAEAEYTVTSRAGSKSSVKSGSCGLAGMAHQWSLPLATLQASSVLFKEYAKLPNMEYNEDTLNDGFLDQDALNRLVCKTAGAASVDDLSAEVKKAMFAADTDGNGVLDFREFSFWYHERTFLECFNLSKEEMHVREVGHKLGLTPADMDNYKRMYDHFDTDGSGDISFDEFEELIHDLLKCKGDNRLPHSRVVHFWHECDADGSGEVDLEEFVTFYIKHFDPKAGDPLTDFYKGQRRVNV